MTTRLTYSFEFESYSFDDLTYLIVTINNYYEVFCKPI